MPGASARRRVAPSAVQRDPRAARSWDRPSQAESTQGLRDVVGSSGDLAVREADDAPTGSCKGGIPGAVALEGVAVVVAGPTVQLYGDAVRSPDGVDAEAFDECVGGRQGQAIAANQPQKGILECGVGGGEPQRYVLRD